jgi:hypothetical protein
MHQGSLSDMDTEIQNTEVRVDTDGDAGQEDGGGWEDLKTSISAVGSYGEIGPQSGVQTHTITSLSCPVSHS